MQGRVEDAWHGGDSMKFFGDVNWHSTRGCVLRFLATSGPLKSEEIAAALKQSYSRRVVFKTLQFLSEEKKITRESNRRPWRLT